MSVGDGAVINYVISSVLFFVIPIFCSTAKYYTVLLEIKFVGSTDGSSSHHSLNQSANLTGLILETTFTNRSLFLYIFEV